MGGERGRGSICRHQATLNFSAPIRLSQHREKGGEGEGGHVRCRACPAPLPKPTMLSHTNVKCAASMAQV